MTKVISCDSFVKFHVKIIGEPNHDCVVSKSVLSYDLTSGSEIMPCNEIDKPLVVYRFSGNVMTSITMLGIMTKL